MAGYVRKTFAAVKAAALMLIFMFCLVPEVSAQTEAPVLDSGNTAWILTSSLLVLLMSIPGIYRAQNEAYKEVNGEKQRKALPVKELCVMAASGRTKRNVYMGLYSV